MATPKYEIDRLFQVINGENREFLKDVVAFGVANCIVKYRDPELIDSMPEWVFELVREICEVYERHGSYAIVSNLGTADHSAMVRELVNLMKSDKRDKPAPSQG